MTNLSHLQACILDNVLAQKIMRHLEKINFEVLFFLVISKSKIFKTRNEILNSYLEFLAPTN